MNNFIITVKDTGEKFECSSNESVIKGMAKLGKKGIPYGCASGACGACKVKVESGSFRKEEMNREYISKREESKEIIQACRIYPQSDLVISIEGAMKKRFLFF